MPPDADLSCTLGMVPFPGTVQTCNAVDGDRGRLLDIFLTDRRVVSAEPSVSVALVRSDLKPRAASRANRKGVAEMHETLGVR